MASLPRRLRKFRPASDALESYRPVSTLVAGFGDAVELPVAQAQAAAKPDEPAVSVAHVSAAKEGSTAIGPPIGDAAPGATVILVSAASVAAPASTLSSTGAGWSPSGISGRSKPATPSIITVSAVSPPPAQPAAQLPQSSAGVGAPSATAESAPTPRDSAGDGIRPMTLAPAAAPFVAGSPASGGGKVAPMNSSGGPTPPAPTVSWSGGTVGPFQGQGTGMITLSDTVPLAGRLMPRRSSGRGGRPILVTSTIRRLRLPAAISPCYRLEWVVLPRQIKRNINLLSLRIRKHIQLL